jgi:hypothetical protein
MLQIDLGTLSSNMETEIEEAKIQFRMNVLVVLGRV